MEESYEIAPGESIGPFRLGMSQEEIERLNIRPMELFRENLGAGFSGVGISVYFDKPGRCHDVLHRNQAPSRKKRHTVMSRQSAAEYNRDLVHTGLLVGVQ